MYFWRKYPLSYRLIEAYPTARSSASQPTVGHCIGGRPIAACSTRGYPVRDYPIGYASGGKINKHVIDQTAVELLLCNCSIDMLDDVTLPTTVLVDAKLTRNHSRTDAQSGTIFASRGFPNSGKGRKIAKLINRPAKSAKTTATIIPGAASTLSILKIAAVVDMNPRNCDRVSDKTNRKPVGCGRTDRRADCQSSDEHRISLLKSCDVVVIELKAFFKLQIRAC